MTHIVEGYKTKKALREAIAGGANPWFYDPSIFKPRSLCANDLALGEEVVVTNHPKRSWFAAVRRTTKGLIVS